MSGGAGRAVLAAVAAGSPDVDQNLTDNGVQVIG